MRGGNSRPMAQPAMFSMFLSFISGCCTFQVVLLTRNDVDAIDARSQG